jgi:Homeodomain-like domain
MFVRPLEIRQQALELAAAGVNDCEIARRLGIPRTTVRDWRNLRYVPKRTAPEPCPRCWRPGSRVVCDTGDYAELLGIYLGDGCISAGARSERLRIFLDAKHTTIVSETEALLQRCFPENRVGRGKRHYGRMVVLSVYARHLSCLLPQHGPGKKHERTIVLEPWQAELCERAPWRLLRGLIRTDGCVFVNRTGRYEYLTYAFCNLSQDILDLFERACLGLGLRPRRTATDIRLNRREDVAQLLEHVGLKA